MYRKLKNILGVSLMVLAIVISQLPMPESQAEIATSESSQSQTHTVTFSMNGGTYNGTYNGYSFNNQTPVLVIDDGEMIEDYPDEKYAVYTGYDTEKGVWYTDNDCLIKYDGKNNVTDSITLYKKWYNITSDGTTSSQKGFQISANGKILYKYDGDDKHVEIPDTVTIIADGAFDNVEDVRGITLPANISKVDENAFSGLKDGNIIYIYDSGTTASKQYGKQLDEEYEQLVYSEYLDIETVEEIAGIEYESEKEQEESSKAEESSSAEESSKTEESSSVEESSKEEESSSVEESSKTEESSSAEESSGVIVIEPDKEYTVTFDTGIEGIKGEDRTVLSGRTISELVEVDGNQPKILKKDTYQIEKDENNQEITYTFKGWYKDKSFTNEWDFANDTVEEDITIYAKWDIQAKNYFYITFSAEGAKNVPEKIKLYEDEELEKPSEIPTIDKMTFKGWFTDEKDSSTEFKLWGKTVSKSMTLYAQFEESGYTVVFHMNGGGFTGNYNGESYTSSASLKTKIVQGKGISSSEYPESDTSALFKYSSYTTDSNWYTDKECLNVYSKKDSNGNDKVLKKDLTLYKKWYYTSSGFTMNTAGKVLYKYNGSSENVNIPSTVTIIGENAFSNVSGISSIILPDGITDIKTNAFSGVKNLSSDITITGKSENAINKAKELANQYTHLVYKDSSDTSNGKNDSSDNSSDVSIVKSGSIKLGADVSGNKSETKNSATSTNTSTSNAAGTIALGANVGNNTTSTTSKQPTAVQPSSDLLSTNTTVVDTSISNNVISNNANTTAIAAKTDNAGAATVNKKTTQKKNLTSASAPKSTRHVKDSTPKTGDPIQYRMLIACAMFSVGALLILTGNGKRKKVSVS